MSDIFKEMAMEMWKQGVHDGIASAAHAVKEYMEHIEACGELHRPELSVLEEVLNILSQEPVIPE